MKHRLFQLQIKNKKVRSYATIDNAIVGAIKVARDQLKVMETLVVYHKDTGLELGTVLSLIHILVFFVSRFHSTAVGQTMA